MPKRKHDQDYENLRKKLKKIEAELLRGRRDKGDSPRRRRRRARVLSSSSDSSQDVDVSRQNKTTTDDCTAEDVMAPPVMAPPATPSKPQARAATVTDVTQPPAPAAAVTDVTQPPAPAAAVTDVTQPPTPAAAVTNVTQPPAPATAVTDVTQPPAQSAAVTEATADANENVTHEPTEEDTAELDADILEILGIDPTATTNYGKDIQKDISVRLEHNAIEGLTKEARKELLDLYPIPNNCKLIGPPALNPELKAASTEISIKRDKAIETKQKVTSAAISSLGQAISHVLSYKEKDTQLLRMLMDTGRLICDCQHSDTLTRRNYVLSSVKKEIRESLQNTKSDTLLFGKDLPDTLKAAKAINKSGSELKVNPTPKPGPSKKFTPGSSKNWKTNTPRKQATATKETKETTTRASTKNQRSSYSRTSSTPRSTRSRR